MQTKKLTKEIALLTVPVVALLFGFTFINTQPQLLWFRGLEALPINKLGAPGVEPGRPVAISIYSNHYLSCGWKKPLWWHQENVHLLLTQAQVTTKTGQRFNFKPLYDAPTQGIVKFGTAFQGYEGFSPTNNNYETFCQWYVPANTDLSGATVSATFLVVEQDNPKTGSYGKVLYKHHSQTTFGAQTLLEAWDLKGWSIPHAQE